MWGRKELFEAIIRERIILRLSIDKEGSDQFVVGKGRRKKKRSTMSNNKIQWDISCVRCSFRGVEPQGERLTYLFLFLYPCVRVWTRLFTARLKSINWKQQKERYKIFGLRKYLCRAKAPQNRLLSHRQNFVRAFSFFLSFLFFSFFFFFAFLSFSFNSLLFFSHCHARWSVTCYVWVKKNVEEEEEKEEEEEIEVEEEANGSIPRGFIPAYFYSSDFVW